MRYRDITESLADAFPIEWQHRTMSSFYGTFMVADEEYFVACGLVEGFQHPDHPGDKRRMGKWYDLTFGIAKDSFLGSKVVGTGGMQFRIFATAIAGFEQFIREVEPEMIMLSASKENENRFGLYQRMARRFDADLRKMGYHAVEPPEHNYADTRAIVDTLAWRQQRP
jgi:hypothetical protein